jgi:ABC-type sugar transport system ATPase subunit
MNIFEVTMGAGRQLVVPGTDFALPLNDKLQRLLGSRTGAKFGVRPWGVKVSSTHSGGSVPGTVSVVEDLGDETHVGVRYGEILLMASIPVTDRLKTGSKVHLTFNHDDLNLFDSATGDRL